MRLNAFEEILSVFAQDLEIELTGHSVLAWLDFWMNPRRLRGSDFLMRWSQGVWSEKRLIQAIQETNKYLAIPYGPSGTAPDQDPREFELYFERLERASTDGLKRPDLLIFKTKDKTEVEGTIKDVGGIEELPFTHEEDPRIQKLLALAVIAVECENSLWRAKRMPDYGAQMTPQKRLGGRAGLKKTAVLPTIIIKEEDRERLQDWQTRRRIPIHIWHVFFDIAFGIAFDSAAQLIREGLILPTEQVFQAPGGATTRKDIYKIYYQYGYLLGESQEDPSLIAAHIMDKNGHILPYVKFEGGKIRLSSEAIQVLGQLVGK